MTMANRADNNDKNAPYPQRNIRPFRFVQPSANVSYDAMTTILNVDFPTNSLFPVTASYYSKIMNKNM